MATKFKPKEQLFCYYYAKLQNSKESALKAGYSSLKAEKQGDKLLQRKDIAKEIKAISSHCETETIMQGVIAGLNRLAFANTNDSIKLLLNNKDDLLDLVDTLDLFHIAEVKIPKENAIEIKFFDRFKAFDKLIELVNLQSDKQESNEFYQALETGAGLLAKGGKFDGV